MLQALFLFGTGFALNIIITTTLYLYSLSLILIINKRKTYLNFYLDLYSIKLLICFRY